MNRRSVSFLLFLVVFLYGGVLTWEGYTFVVGQQVQSSLLIDRTEQVALRQDGAADLVLSGSGFDSQTRIIVSADIGNQRAIVEHIPLWGNAADIVMTDQFIYIANARQGLQLLSLRDPLRPVLEKTYTVLGGVSAVELHDNHVYLVRPAHGVYVHDLLPNGYLGKSKRVDLSGDSLACAVKGGALFVASGHRGVRIIDISRISEPNASIIYPIIAHVETPSRALDLILAGETLYVSTEKTGVLVYDVANPAQPHLLSRFHEGNRAMKIAVEENRLFLGDKSGDISIYDVSAPSSPVLERTFPGNARATDFSLDGDTLYVADAYAGLVELDLKSQDPADFKKVDLSGMARAVSLRDGYAYVASGLGGLQIIDLSLFDVPQDFVRLKPSVRSRSVFKEGDLLFHADVSSVQLLKRSGPGHVQIVATLQAKNVYDLEKNGDFLYLANRNGISIYEVSDPNRPVRLGEVTLPGSSNEIVVVGSRLFVSSPKGLYVLDLADPTHPRLIETFPMTYPRAMATNGTHLYVGTRYNGVQIFDLHDGQSPSLVGSYTLQWPLAHFERILAIEERSGLLYLATGENGLQIVDVKNPAQPELLGSVAIPGYSRGVQLEGDRAYVLDARNGVSLVDISSPEEPRNLGLVVSKSNIRTLLPLGDSLLLAANLGGLLEVPRPQEVDTFQIQGDNLLRVSIPDPGHQGRYSLHISNRNQQTALPGIVRF